MIDTMPKFEREQVARLVDYLIAGDDYASLRGHDGNLSDFPISRQQLRNLKGYVSDGKGGFKQPRLSSRRLSILMKRSISKEKL